MGRFFLSILWAALALFLVLSSEPAFAASPEGAAFEETVESDGAVLAHDSPDHAPQESTEVHTTREEVRVERGTGDFMGVIARNAFFGALLGGLIGGAGYLLSGRDWSPWNIAYFAAGGVIVGTAAGLVELMIRETQRPPVASLEWMERQMPRTVVVPLMQVGF
jgi:hypothetical protein